MKEEGGLRQRPLSGTDEGGRIDARFEKAACAFERAPCVGSTDVHPGPRLGPVERVTRAGLALQERQLPGRDSPDESPGSTPRTKGPPAGRAEDPSLGCVC